MGAPFSSVTRPPIEAAFCKAIATVPGAEMAAVIPDIVTGRYSVFTAWMEYGRGLRPASRNLPFPSVRAFRVGFPSWKNEKPPGIAAKRTPERGRRVFSSTTLPVTDADRASRRGTSEVSPFLTRTLSF